MRHFSKDIFRGGAAIAATSCLLALTAAAATEGSFHSTLKVSGNVNIELSSGSGNIEVRTGNNDEVRIDGRIKIHDWFESKAGEKIKRLEDNPPIEQNGNDIKIGRIEDPDLQRHVSISYEVILPADARLHAETGSGEAKIDGVRGSLDVSSGSGRLQLSNIDTTVRASAGSGEIEIDQVKGNVHAKTGSGSIRAIGIAGGFEGSTGSGGLKLEQTSPGSVRVSAGSGTLDLRGLHGSLDATAGSGSIRAEGDPTGSWNVRTGSGSVDLRLPSNASFDLNAHSSSGSISVGFPVVSEASDGRKDLRGKVRGGGVSIQIVTGSGSIGIH